MNTMYLMLIIFLSEQVLYYALFSNNNNLLNQVNQMNHFNSFCITTNGCLLKQKYFSSHVRNCTSYFQEIDAISESENGKVANIIKQQSARKDYLYKIFNTKVKSGKMTSAEYWYERAKINYQLIHEFPNANHEGDYSEILYAAELLKTDPQKGLELAEDIREKTHRQDTLEKATALCNRYSLFGKRLAWSFETLNGQSLLLNDMRGKVVVICFWHILRLSQKDILYLNEVFSRYHTNDVIVVGVHFSSKDPKPDEVDNIIHFASTNKIKWIQCWTKQIIKYRDDEVPNAYKEHFGGWGKNIYEINYWIGKDFFPCIWLVDRSGRLRFINISEWSKLRMNIDSLIREFNK